MVFLLVLRRLNRLATNHESALPRRAPEEIAPDLPALIDTLGTEAFGKDLGARLLRFTGGEGIVFGLEGPWGAGKSSVINFARAYIEQQRSENPSAAPEIVIFNPWWFASVEDLREQFFAELVGQLD